MANHTPLAPLWSPQLRLLKAAIEGGCDIKNSAYYHYQHGLKEGKIGEIGLALY